MPTYNRSLLIILRMIANNWNYLYIHLKIVDNTLAFDIYYKLTNSSSYLTYSTCPPGHTKNNIALSLAKRIINLVTDNKEKRLSGLKKQLIERNHPPELIDYTFAKFQSKLDKNKDLEKIIFSRTLNRNHVINLSKFTRSIDNIRSNELKQCFQNKIAQLATRQPKNLQKILAKANFEENHLFLLLKKLDFLSAMILLSQVWIIQAVQMGSMIWHYKRFFNCYSNKVINTLMCNTCKSFYMRQTTNLRQKITKLFINQMFFIIGIVFVRNAQSIYAIVVERKELFQHLPSFI